MADRETFGYKECPDSQDADIRLLLTYSCDGGGNDLTIIRKPICDNIRKIPRPTATPRTTPSTQPTPATTQQLLSVAIEEPIQELAIEEESDEKELDWSDWGSVESLEE